MWIRLRLPSYGPGFKSPAKHLCFLMYKFKIYSTFVLDCIKNKNKQRGLDWAKPIFEKHISVSKACLNHVKHFNLLHWSNQLKVSSKYLMEKV